MADKGYYARIVHIDEGPDVFSYSVFFPDIPGCITCGDTRDEAIAMAKEALECWFDDDDVEAVTPSCLDDLLTQEDSTICEDELSHEYVLIEI